jgi:hypothetical protein
MVPLVAARISSADASFFTRISNRFRSGSGTNSELNKVIAAELNIAMRTVEVHRARVFEKMGVKSAVELAQRLAGKDG